MSEMDSLESETEFEFLLFNAVRRIGWGKSHVSKLQNFWSSEGSNFASRGGVLYDSAGVNLFALQINQFVHSATRSLQAAAELTRMPLGPVPIEQLLRGALLYSFKALYILQPDEQETRNLRAQKLYAKDRWEYQNALWESGELLDQDPGPKPTMPKAPSETKMLRATLDFLLDQGNCKCEQPGCPDYDFIEIRHRTIAWWRLYSSVVHGQLWHIEASGVMAPSEKTVTTGNLAQAMWDITWMFQQSVGMYLTRFGLGHQIEPFVVDWDRG